MRSTGVVRKLDQLGRIVLPKGLRKKLNIERQDGLEIYIDRDRIILRKYAPACIFCGQRENVIIFKDKKICKECIDNLK